MNRNSKRPLLLCILLGWTASGCVEGADVKRNPVPPADKLTAADCEPGIAAYRLLLDKPATAGVLVTGRQVRELSPEEKELYVAEFSAICHGQLVGRARRVIVRCWTDSPDVRSFRRCNERF